MSTKIPNAPLRAAFLRSNLTAAEVARRAGWWSSGGVDTSRVNRTLGLMQETSRGESRFRESVDVEIVALLAEAIGVAPWEVGA